ncbi:FxLYD domain-containing protein [Streptomyces luteolus]|uniref:FxLYD domain-containing protein n=1 Tax=Streptomyces luteolus TaxID=3043615 RepID=A0ABT6SVL6_9ACTN|nr:FxLYD domain-containing protein [Streptomyces sp. B-S-A12]MDI3419153.1 FxLYD domain-containing protein [Streptomyces sp. B-S-A12]
MARHRLRHAVAAVLTALVAAGAVGCTDDGSGPSDAASKAASAAESAAGRVTDAASRAADALASASAAADRKMKEIKGGVDAKDEVELGAADTDGQGRSTVDVTAENTADSAKSFAVKVDFKDKDGKLVDTVVVTVKDVAAGAEGKGTARSTHKLSGEVRTEVGQALRY